MAKSIFSQIIDREVPAHFIYEDDACIAILDKFPTVRGQALVIPKTEVDYIFDLDDETYTHLWEVTKKVARALDAAIAPERTCIVVEGFDVPHVHVKLYPMQESDKPLGARLAMGKEAGDEELALIATQIAAALNKQDAA